MNHTFSSDPLTEILKKSDLTEIGKSTIKFTGKLFDSTLPIPIVSPFIDSIEFKHTISKQITAKKIYDFLRQIEDISPEVRMKKINEIDVSTEYRFTVGEKLFEILDKLDIEYAQIAGKMLKAVLQDEIQFKELLKVCHILKNIFYYDLIDLKNSYDGNYIYNSLPDDNFIMLGIVEVPDFAKGLNELMISNTKKQPPKKKKLTKLGKILVELGMSN